MDDLFQTLNTRFRVVLAQFDHTDAQAAYQRAMSLVDTQAIKRTQAALRDAATELMRAEIAARDGQQNLSQFTL